MAKEDPVELYCSLHLFGRHLYRVYAGARETTSPGVVEATMEHRMRVLVKLIHQETRVDGQLCWGGKVPKK